MLKQLFISKTRINILKLFLTHPQKVFHVREISRQVGAEINAVRRELLRLAKIKFLKCYKSGNRVIYALCQDFIFNNELLAMLAKEIGLGGKIIKEEKNLGRIKFAALRLAFVKGKAASSSQVDLFVVGENINVPLLASLIKEEQHKRGYEINYTVLSNQEFAFRKKRKDAFVLNFLMRPKIMVVGDEEDFGRI